ncbi:hypothetical protein E2542_SST24785 [Spatholobus suberectus]|nr:hypothetical protein E2542_SST24785 [Spatholobus suberectus]
MRTSAIFDSSPTHTLVLAHLLLPFFAVKGQSLVTRISGEPPMFHGLCCSNATPSSCTPILLMRVHPSSSSDVSSQSLDRWVRRAQQHTQSITAVTTVRTPADAPVTVALQLYHHSALTPLCETTLIYLASPCHSSRRLLYDVDGSLISSFTVAGVRKPDSSLRR